MSIVNQTYDKVWRDEKKHVYFGRVPYSGSSEYFEQEVSYTNYAPIAVDPNREYDTQLVGTLV